MPQIETTVQFDESEEGRLIDRSKAIEYLNALATIAYLCDEYERASAFSEAKRVIERMSGTD
jgi:hypothetical protein